MSLHLYLQVLIQQFLILRSNVHLYFKESLINDHENVSKILQENYGSQHLDNDTVTVEFSNSDRSSFEVLLDQFVIFNP